MEAEIPGNRHVGQPEGARKILMTSETWMNALLDAAVDCIITIDERGIIQTINRAAEQLFG